MLLLFKCSRSGAPELQTDLGVSCADQESRNHRNGAQTNKQATLGARMLILLVCSLLAPCSRLRGSHSMRHSGLQSSG